MGDHTLLVGHENGWSGDSVPGFVGEAFIHDTKGLDDRCVFVS